MSNYTFMGANLRDVSIRLGWGVNEVSTLNATLVDDGTNNFTTQSLGTPVSFTAGSCTFRGLLQKYGQSKNVRGGISWEVQVVDPRIILANADIITGGYNGTTQSMKNLYNVFAYYENIAFGGSRVNETGMLYSLVLSALSTLISGAQGNYGGPLHFRGLDYTLDMTEVPTPPADYRVGSQGSINLLELIDQVCTDAGYDFYVTLVGSVITIKTVSRISAPPLGTITTFISAQEGNDLVSSQAGLELRNDEMSRFLVGGDIKILYTTNDLTSYWGNDLNGNAILGSGTRAIAIGPDGQILFSEPMDVMYLNASPVADVLGATTYYSNTIEMRAALHGYADWATFMQNHKSGIADSIGLYSLSSSQNNRPDPLAQALGGNIIPTTFLNDSVANQARAAAVAANNGQRLYEFVRSYATDFYGKKYAVQIPFVSQKTDEDTGVITYSHEPTDGGFLEDGSAPLGLETLNEDVFKLQDGRFGPFVRFTNLGTGVDFTRFSPSDTVLQTQTYSASGNINSMFARANLEDRIYFTPDPVVIIDLPAAMVNKENSAVGDTTFAIAALASAPNQSLQDAAAAALSVTNPFVGFGPLTEVAGLAAVGAIRNNIPFGSTPAFYLAPATVAPAYAAVPLKSNILTYGPWYAQGPQGSKLRFEQDGTLVPWNYGSFANMNLAAAAKVANVATNTEVLEAGFIEQEGLPDFNLGDTLALNGPNITNMNINFRVDGGITTTYNFQSFTVNRLGSFNRRTDEKIRRLGIISQNLRREVRTRANEIKLRNEIRSDARRGYFENMSRVQRRESPHPMIVSQVLTDPSGFQRIGTAFMTNEEAVIAVQPVESGYRNVGAVSLGGMFVPAATTSNSTLPELVTPATNFSSINVTGLTIYRAYAPNTPQAVEFIANATGYEGIYTYGSQVQQNIASGEEQRFVALRGPVHIAGFGPSMTGGYNGVYSNVNSWRVGPLDAMFDPYRGVWTNYSFLRAQLQESLSANGSASAFAYGSNNLILSGVKIIANDFFGSALASGVKVGLSFDPYIAKWYVTSAAC